MVQCASVMRWIDRTVKVAILSSCLFNFVATPYFDCLLHVSCTKHRSIVSGIFSRTLCVTCFASYIFVCFRYGPLMAAYGRWIESHDAVCSSNRSSGRRRARAECRVIRACVAACFCLAIILPVNVARLYFLHKEEEDTWVLVFFFVMYSQNISQYVLETRFTMLCREVHFMFADINRDLERIDGGIAVVQQQRYQDEFAAVVVRSGGGGGSAEREEAWTAVPDGVRHSLYRSQHTGRPLVEAIEELKVRHRLVRDAFNQLGDLFAVPVGLSLGTLFVMALFDIYYYTIDPTKIVKTTVFTYMWLLQYGMRFFMIVESAHVTTKQALKSKEIVLNINRIFLDISTKDELQLFSNQLSSSKMEFTVYGFFTLNSRLVISAFGMVLTYLVLWIQMFTDVENINH